MTCEQIVEIWQGCGHIVLFGGWTALAMAVVCFGLTFINNRATAADRLAITWLGIVGGALVLIGTKMIGG